MHRLRAVSAAPVALAPFCGKMVAAVLSLPAGATAIGRESPRATRLRSSSRAGQLLCTAPPAGMHRGRRSAAVAARQRSTGRSTWQEGRPSGPPLRSRAGRRPHRAKEPFDAEVKPCRPGVAPAGSVCRVSPPAQHTPLTATPACLTAPAARHAVRCAGAGPGEPRICCTVAGRSVALWHCFDAHARFALPPPLTRASPSPPSLPPFLPGRGFRVQRAQVPCRGAAHMPAAARRARRAAACCGRHFSRSCQGPPLRVRLGGGRRRGRPGAAGAAAAPALAAAGQVEPAAAAAAAASGERRPPPAGLRRPVASPAPSTCLHVVAALQLWPRPSSGRSGFRSVCHWTPRSAPPCSQNVCAALCHLPPCRLIMSCGGGNTTCTLPRQARQARPLHTAGRCLSKCRAHPLPTAGLQAPAAARAAPAAARTRPRQTRQARPLHTAGRRLCKCRARPLPMAGPLDPPPVPAAASAGSRPRQAAAGAGLLPLTPLAAMAAALAGCGPTAAPLPPRRGRHPGVPVWRADTVPAGWCGPPARRGWGSTWAAARAVTPRRCCCAPSLRSSPSSDGGEASCRGTRSSRATEPALVIACLILSSTCPSASCSSARSVSSVAPPMLLAAEAQCPMPPP